MTVGAPRILENQTDGLSERSVRVDVLTARHRLFSLLDQRIRGNGQRWQFGFALLWQREENRIALQPAPFGKAFAHTSQRQFVLYGADLGQRQSTFRRPIP